MLLRDSSITNCAPCTSRRESGDGHQSMAPLTSADTRALGYRPRDPSDSRHAFGLNSLPEIRHADLVTLQKCKGQGGFERGRRRLRHKSCKTPAHSFPVAITRAACWQRWRMLKGISPPRRDLITRSACSAAPSQGFPSVAVPAGGGRSFSAQMTGLEQITEMLSFISHATGEGSRGGQRTHTNHHKPNHAPGQGQ